MRTVIVESPFAGWGSTDLEIQSNQQINEDYLSACLRDCVANREESPYASHRMLTGEGVLDDTIKTERDLGIMAGFAFRRRTDASVFYVDRGFTAGMNEGLVDALLKMQVIEFRSIGWHCVQATEAALTDIHSHAVRLVLEHKHKEIEARQMEDPDFCMYLLGQMD